MATRLRDFNLPEAIGIDANIFDYHFEKHMRLGADCSEFLLRLEEGHISAVTTSIVIVEVVRFLQMRRGELLLGVQNWPRIQAEFRANAAFANELWDAASQGLDYVEKLTRTGLTIIEVSTTDFRLAEPIGRQYRLFAPDAVFAYHCQLRGIAQMASNDADFDRVPFLTRWKPEQDASGTASESEGDS